MPVSSVEQKVSVANAYLMKNDMFQNYANDINIGGGGQWGALNRALHTELIRLHQVTGCKNLFLVPKLQIKGED